MGPNLIIFDFDGVIADSEVVACEVAAAYATELGYPLSAEEGLSLFMGKRAAEVRSMVENHSGKPQPDFENQLLERTIGAFSRELNPVKGVVAFLDRHSDVPRCIASSSSHARLDASLRRLGLTDRFAGAVFSADDVGRGKPFPDLFLFASERMRVDPRSAIVIEDSPAGVMAGKAAGMTTYGILAGSHARHGLREQLHAAGADVIVDDFQTLSQLIDPC